MGNANQNVVNFVKACDECNGGAVIRTSYLIRTRKINFNSDKNYTYGVFEKRSKHRVAIKSINYLIKIKYKLIMKKFVSKGFLIFEYFFQTPHKGKIRIK